mgnify:CR=1 FL=1
MTFTALFSVCAPPKPKAYNNLATEKASVIYDPSVVKEGDFLALIRDIGYDVPTAKAELPITGMTCANCVAAVERNLKKVDGVQVANVNLSSERATIEYDGSIFAFSIFVIID